MTELASAQQLRASFLRWALVLVPGIVLLGYVSAVVGGSGPANPWFAGLVKPGVYPAPVVFPVVWTALYILMAVALAVVITAAGARGRGLAIGLFGAQLLLNLAWSPVFFGAHRIGLALGVIAALIVLVAATLAAFARVRPVAAALLVPYLAWLCFAAVLNWQILTLNPGADGQSASGAAVRVQIGS